jgi:hypothetical protein
MSGGLKPIYSDVLYLSVPVACFDLVVRGHSLVELSASRREFILLAQRGGASF